MNKPFGVSSMCIDEIYLGRFYNRVQQKTSWLAVRKCDISKTSEISSISNHIMRHRNLVNVINPTDRYYFSWQLRGTPLSSIITSIKLPESNISIICHDVLQALVYLHDMMIIHRNVRPENILICSNGKVTLGCQPSDHSSISNLDADRYVAPEIMEGKSYGRKVDVWSLGAVAVYMKRFDANNCGKKVEMSVKMRAFVDRCLKRNPEKRLCSKQVAKSSFVVNHETYKKFAASMIDIDDRYG